MPVSWLILGCMRPVGKMKPVMTFILPVFVILQASADSSPCPINCTCDNTVRTALKVDCQNRTDTDSHRIYNELESLLADIARGELQSLAITKTFLTDLPQSVCRLTSLTHINVNENHLSRLPDNCLIKLTQLQVFQASSNQITELQDGLFDGLQQLREIILDFNRIARIGSRLFSNSSDLTNLRNIQLEYNQLTSIEPWPLIRGLVGSVESRVTISVHANQISFGKNPLNWTFSCNMRPFVHVDMGYNNISHIADIMNPLIGIGGIKYACLTNFHTDPDGRAIPKTSYNIDGNRLVCDCVDFFLYKLEAFSQFAHIFAGSYCTSPIRLMDIEIPRIPLTEFVCDTNDKCPVGCQCFYRPADLSMNVNCTSANMTSLPEQLPERPKGSVKYRLAFDSNRFLDKLKFRDYFSYTDEFDAGRSGISHIDLDFWSQLSRVKKVSLRDNMLTSLPVSLTNVSISSNEIDLSRNPWDCSCEQKWMTAWLNSIQDKLSSADAIQCATPDRLLGKNMLKMTDSEYCYVQPRDLRPFTIAVSTISGCVVLVLVVYLTVYRLRMMLFTRWKFHPFDRDECDCEDMDYDVFLCCSSEDNVHGTQILQRLEDNDYRVCYHLRDFLGGFQIEENIIASVQRSKRTVCLITDNFIRSAYCMHEFVVALNHNVNIKRTRLIVLMASNNTDSIALGDADFTADLEILRQYLRQYTYIDYAGGKWFEKLCYSLPVNGMNRNRAGGDDDDDNNDDDVQLLE